MKKVIASVVLSLASFISSAQELPKGVTFSEEFAARCATENGCRVMSADRLSQLLAQVRIETLKEGAELGYVAGFETGEKKSCRVDAKFVNLNLN